jgi:polyisoprenoid-binding protein YceI
VRVRTALRAALCLGALLASSAQAEALRVDDSQSRATFSLRALLVKRIEGEFSRVEGVITRDAAAGRFGVDVRIDANSVSMSRASFADWARSADFFDAARHPWIRFRADDQPERALRDGGEVHGELTLRGVTRSASFVLEPSECPRPGIDCAVRARGEVRRGDFGMDARRIVLGDRVRLEFAIRAQAPAPQPASVDDAG